MTREYLKMEQEGASFEELEYMTLGSLRKAVMHGDVKGGTVMAGQLAGLVQKEQSCAEILQEMLREAKEMCIRDRREDGQKPDVSGDPADPR